MDENFDDRELIECFNVIYELYPGTRRAIPEMSDRLMPSPAEGTDALRLYAQIDSAEMRTALRMLLRTLGPSTTSGGPSDPDHLAASKPN